MSLIFDISFNMAMLFHAKKHRSMKLEFRQVSALPCQVFSMLKQQRVQEKCGLVLNGFNVCQKSFHLLLGFGKFRMGRLRRAVISGQETCPMDKRRAPKKWSVIPGVNSARAKVHQWLMQAYHKLAEPLPEAIVVQPAVSGPGEQKPKCVKKRGKRPHRLVKHDRPGYHAAVKFLPPGTILSYLQLCRADLTDVSVSRTLFCRVSWQCSDFWQVFKSLMITTTQACLMYKQNPDHPDRLPGQYLLLTLSFFFASPITYLR